MDNVKGWFRVGLKVAAFLYLFEKFALPSDKVRKSVEGLEQPRLNFQSHETYELLDPKTGELQIMGWEIDGEKNIVDNSEKHSRALWDPSLSGMKQREVNVFFINTPHHYIEVLTPFKVGSLDLIAAVTVVDLDASKPGSYL